MTVQDTTYDNTPLPMPDNVPGEHEADVQDMFDTWHTVRGRNEELRRYYRQHNPMVEISRDDVTATSVHETVGWCKAVVDSMAARSQFDGYLFEGVQDRDFDRLVNRNRIDSDLYQKCLVSSLIYGVGFLSVMKGGAFQPAKVRAYSAQQGCGIYDKDEDGLACGVVLSGTDRNGRANRYTAFWPDSVVTFTYNENTSHWDSSVQENGIGEMLLVPMVFEPDCDRPLGHSRITPEVMRTTDRAMRQLRNLDVGCESYIWPQRWMMGVDSDLFEQHDEDGNVIGVNKTRREVYQGRILALTRDEDGNVPTVGQFAQASVEPIVTAYEQAAQQISGASHIPMNELGVLSSNYTSSEALSASTNALVLDVERMNRRNAATMEQVARLMMCVAWGITPEQMNETQRRMFDTVAASFRDPSMPTAAAVADAQMKLGTADKRYPATRTFWESVGWPKSKIDRYEAEVNEASAIAALNQIASQM